VEVRGGYLVGVVGRRGKERNNLVVGIGVFSK